MSVILQSIGGGVMTFKAVVRESRRSTRVRLQVRIEALGMSEPLTCGGETLVVNLHGALILSAVALRVGMTKAYGSSSRCSANNRWISVNWAKRVGTS